MTTALVPVAPSDGKISAGLCATSRPSADFLAQLIATVEKAPQTRMRRRAAPHEAIAAYRAFGPNAAAGRALSRSL